MVVIISKTKYLIFHYQRKTVETAKTNIRNQTTFKTALKYNLVVGSSDCLCSSCNGPESDPSIRQHSGIGGAEDEGVLNIHSRKKIKNPPPQKKKKYIYLNK